MERFEDHDLFHIEDEFNDEERMVRDTVRSWIEKRVMPHIESWAWESVFPLELVKEMADLDLLGKRLPREGAHALLVTSSVPLFGADDDRDLVADPLAAQVFLEARDDVAVPVEIAQRLIAD